MPGKARLPLFPLLETETQQTEDRIDWDFKTADTQYLTHGLHPYPARMIPQIANKLIDMYLSGMTNSIVLDVFCGSGTVNVEAALRGFKSIGIDINPFAVLLASAKAANVIDAQKLSSFRDRFEKRATGSYKPSLTLIPSYKNIDHWFKPKVMEKLSYLKKVINSIRDNNVRNLLWIAFANTLIKSSNVDWKSSRYIRVLPKEELEDREPDVFKFFSYYIFDLWNRIKQYSEKRKAEALILRADARRLPLADESADLIVTSPPYGEERNTIPYIRWSKLFLLWLGIPDTKIVSLEKQALGGNSNHSASQDDIPSKTFWQSVTGVPDDRMKEALPFMKDYIIALAEMRRVLKPRARCCIVIGHRSIQRHLIDMGKVTQELGSHVGFELEDMFGRSIPKKMIPWTTPTGETIFDESIVILRKPK